MAQVISVEGIECFAYHGCLPEEAIIGGKYSVDIYVHAKVSKSFYSDHLDDTVDYSVINNIVREQMAIRSNLIEHIANRILVKLKDQIKNYDNIVVRVTKFNPPVEGNIRRTSFLVSSAE